MFQMRRIAKWIAETMAMIFLVSGCAATEQKPAETNDKGMVSGENRQDEVSENEPEKSQEPQKTVSFINAAGKTLKTRILVPQGYERVNDGADSLASFLQNYKVKKDGSPVLLYDGTKKGNQDAHVAVLKLPIEPEDLQQCADSVMRVYGEYYYKYKKYKRIRFSMGGGFVADFDKWSRGYGIGVRGDTLYWTEQPSHDDSYSSFKKFMRMVFAYSGTLNLESDSRKIKIKDISVGDIFIKGGSPGHVVMVADLCRDEKGRKAFLLAQGYMPAQEFHVLKNPLHEEDPWYYEEEIRYPLQTPEYMFEKGTLRRPFVSI